MKLLFRPLAHIHLWHDFFLGQPTEGIAALPEGYDVGAFLTIEPDARSRRILANHRLRWLTTPSGGTLFAEAVEQAGESLTKIPLPDRMKLSFWLRVSQPAVYAFSNFPFSRQKGHLLHLSNRVDNATIERFLTRPMPSFNSGEAYEIGALVQSGGQVWEATKGQSGAAPGPDPAVWQAFPESQYVTAQDFFPRKSQFLSHVASGLDPGQEVHFQLTTEAGNSVWESRLIGPKEQRPGFAPGVDCSPMGYLSSG
ncbi:MAG: hypothetical protein AAF399_25590 [Bacteroidota bacterium]